MGFLITQDVHDGSLTKFLFLFDFRTNKKLLLVYLKDMEETTEINPTIID